MRKIKNIITIDLILPLLLCLLLPAVSKAAFSDVTKDHINHIAVNYLQENGISQGYGSGTYKPEEMINRAEALKIILISQKISPSSSSSADFSDVDAESWYAPYVSAALNQNIIQTNLNGTFEPERNITRAEFMKMLLLANGFKESTWGSRQIFPDVPPNVWFTPYMNYAGKAGIVSKDIDNNIYPSRIVSRGEVAETIYLLYLIENRANNTLLLLEADKHMAQLEYCVNNDNLVTAKKTAGIFVSITQQTYRNNPTNKLSLGKAKLARAYDFLINGKISREQNNPARGEAWEELAKTKAIEATQADKTTAPTAANIENLAEQN